MEIKKTFKSFSYKCRITKKALRIGEVDFAEDKPTLIVASPPEFKGYAGIISPEDLFLASVSACTLMTFESFAERMNVAFSAYQADAEGLVEHDGEKYRFAKVWIKPKITVPNEEMRAKALEALEKAHKYCLVSASLNTRVEVEGEVIIE